MMCLRAARDVHLLRLQEERRRGSEQHRYAFLLPAVWSAREFLRLSVLFLTQCVPYDITLGVKVLSIPSRHFC